MVIDLEEVRDIKKWVGDSIELIRAPHHYRFKWVGKEVEMTYKHWADDEVWEALDQYLISIDWKVNLRIWITDGSWW